MQLEASQKPPRALLLVENKNQKIPQVNIYNITDDTLLTLQKPCCCSTTVQNANNSLYVLRTDIGMEGGGDFHSFFKTFSNKYHAKNQHACLRDTIIHHDTNFSLSPCDVILYEYLGYGAEGTVFKAYNTKLNVWMAVKNICMSNSRPNNSIKNQLNILQECCSDFISKYYGFIMDKNELSLCFEYMDYGSLDHLLKKLLIDDTETISFMITTSSQKLIPENILLFIIYSILKGLDYLSSKNIIHRDIKPSNILIHGSGEIKISDFGLSTCIPHMQLDSFVGSSAYMAPERILGNPYSFQSDIWSIGMIILELSYKTLPISDIGNEPNMYLENLSLFEQLTWIFNEEIPSLPSCYSSALSALVSSCLQKDPKLRPMAGDLLRMTLFDQLNDLNYFKAERYHFSQWMKHVNSN